MMCHMIVVPQPKSFCPHQYRAGTAAHETMRSVLVILVSAFVSAYVHMHIGKCMRARENTHPITQLLLNYSVLIDAPSGPVLLWLSRSQGQYRAPALRCQHKQHSKWTLKSCTNGHQQACLDPDWQHRSC